MTQPYSSTFYALGTQSQVVKYIGDGTASKVISLNFTPRMVVIIRNTYNVSLSDIWFGDLASGWCLVQSGATLGEVDSAGHPSFFPFVTNGFDAGKANAFTAHGNTSGIAYTLIALG